MCAILIGSLYWSVSIRFINVVQFWVTFVQPNLESSMNLHWNNVRIITLFQWRFIEIMNLHNWSSLLQSVPLKQTDMVFPKLNKLWSEYLSFLFFSDVWRFGFLTNHQEKVSVFSSHKEVFTPVVYLLWLLLKLRKVQMNQNLIWQITRKRSVCLLVISSQTN